MENKSASLHMALMEMISAKEIQENIPQPLISKIETTAKV